MRNFTEIYSQIATDPTTRCSCNSVIFTTAIDLEIKCGVGSTRQRKEITFQHRGQLRQLPRVIIGAIIPREYTFGCAASQITDFFLIASANCYCSPKSLSQDSTRMFQQVFCFLLLCKIESSKENS